MHNNTEVCRKNPSSTSYFSWRPVMRQKLEVGNEMLCVCVWRVLLQTLCFASLCEILSSCCLASYRSFVCSVPEHFLFLWLWKFVLDLSAFVLLTWFEGSLSVFLAFFQRCVCFLSACTFSVLCGGVGVRHSILTMEYKPTLFHSFLSLS